MELGNFHLLWQGSPGLRQDCEPTSRTAWPAWLAWLLLGRLWGLVTRRLCLPRLLRRGVL